MELHWEVLRSTGLPCLVFVHLQAPLPTSLEFVGNSAMSIYFPSCPAGQQIVPGYLHILKVFVKGKLLVKFEVRCLIGRCKLLNLAPTLVSIVGG